MGYSKGIASIVITLMTLVGLSALSGGEVVASEDDRGQQALAPGTEGRDQTPFPMAPRRDKIGDGGHRDRVPFPATDCGNLPCYFAGEEYNPWTETHHNLVEVSIRVPDHPPRVGDYYYVLLSIWDNTNRYDQIGFASYPLSNPPVWGLVRSYSEPCPIYYVEYHHVDNALPGGLAAGQTYTFRMSVGSGALSFHLLSRGSFIWSEYVPSTASYFKAVEEQVCPEGVYRGYTHFEEVWDLSGPQPVPEWSFRFIDAKLDGSPVAGDWWSFYDDSPVQVKVMVSFDDMTIDNHYFELQMAIGSSMTVYQGMTSFSRQGNVVLLHNPLDCLFTSCVVDLSVNQKPATWTVTITPTSGMPNYGFTVSFTIPPNAPIGGYGVELRGINTPRSQHTYLWMRITVKQTTVGGCVATGTLIRTPSGSVPVQNLVLGAQVLSYDLASQSLVVSQVVSNSASTQSAVLQLAHSYGSLQVTPRDQPVYMKNDTFNGWLSDPQELLHGDLIYNPMTNLWSIVLDSSFVMGTSTVYSLVPSLGGGTFMAGDMLLMRK